MAFPGRGFPRAGHDDRARGGTGIYPNVQCVIRFGGYCFGAFFHILRALTSFQSSAADSLEPDVRPMLFNQVSYISDYFAHLGSELPPASKKGRNWHTPGTLPGDAPVRPALHCALDSINSPCRNPPDAFDFLYGFAPKRLGHVKNGTMPILLNPPLHKIWFVNSNKPLVS
jgi:hypothetical protein